jgi:predicted dehydrogenase
MAIIGAGYWGPNLFRNFTHGQCFSVVHVCDRDLERAQRMIGTRNEITLSDSLDEVLDDTRVKAVAIATPPSTHFEFGMACLEAGRHVLMEKPLATTAADGIALTEAAEEAGLVLMNDHTFCYTPAVTTMREYIRDGRVGNILNVESIRVNLGLVRPDVDVFWDLASHDLAIFDFVLPKECAPIAIGAYGADPIGAGKTCIGYLTLSLANGAIAHVTVSWISPAKIRQMIVSGSNQMIVWDDMRPYQRLSVFDCGVEILDSTEEDRRALEISYRKGDMTSPALPETLEALQFVVDEFRSAIVERRPALTDGWSGVRVLQLLEASGKSVAADGALVSVETSSA